MNAEINGFLREAEDDSFIVCVDSKIGDWDGDIDINDDLC